MYVRLNLATRPLLSHRRFLVAAALLGLLGSILFMFLGWRFYTVRKADEEFRARGGKMQEQMSQLLQQKADLDQFYAHDENRHLQERAKFVDGIVESRSFNWTKMFMDLENLLPVGARVVRIEPKLDHGTAAVRFVVGATSQESRDQLLKAFEDSRSFSHVEVYSVSLPKQAGSDPFTVEFSAIYTGI